MSNLMREDFSKWAASQFEIPESLIVWTEESPDDGYPVRLVNERGEQSDEANSIVGVAWLAFQASRAVLVVKLPESEIIDRGWDEAGNATWSEVMDYDQTIKALAAAGVTAK